MLCITCNFIWLCNNHHRWDEIDLKKLISDTSLAAFSRFPSSTKKWFLVRIFINFWNFVLHYCVKQWDPEIRTKMVSLIVPLSVIFKMKFVRPEFNEEKSIILYLYTFGSNIKIKKNEFTIYLLFSSFLFCCCCCLFDRYYYGSGEI